MVKAPSVASDVEMATDKNEISTGETQAPNISAEIIPSKNTIPIFPPLIP